MDFWLSYLFSQKGNIAKGCRRGEEEEQPSVKSDRPEYRACGSCVDQQVLSDAVLRTKPGIVP
jgi:hypothetical protein